MVAVALVEDPSVRLLGNLLRREGAPIEEIRPAEVEIGAPEHAVFDAHRRWGES